MKASTDGKAGGTRVDISRGYAGTGQGREAAWDTEVRRLGTHLVQAQTRPGRDGARLDTGSAAGLEGSLEGTLANPGHLAKLKEGVELWNKRSQGHAAEIGLTEAALRSTDLKGADSSEAYLCGMELSGFNLSGANLERCQIEGRRSAVPRPE